MNILKVLTDKRIKGNIGEDAAARYLKRRLFRILERNYVANGHEVDIIATNRRYLCFVEVKTRKAGTMVSPVEAVDYRKQQKIILTAQDYMMKNESEKQPRFDIFEVWHNEGRIYKFNHIESAFDFQY